MGKFSAPRNRAPQPERPETNVLPPEEVQESGMPPLERETLPEETMAPPEQNPIPDEEGAMDRAFRQVAEPGRSSSSWVLEFVSQHRNVLIIGVCALVLVILIATVGIIAFGKATDPYDGKILNNVTVGGIHVGGLTRSQAENVVKSATSSTFTQQDMVVTLPDATLRLSPADTGAKLDVGAAVKAAFQYGRTGSQAEREAAYEASLTGSHTVALLPYLHLKEEFILQTIQEYTAGHVSAYTDWSYMLEGQQPALEEDRFDPDAPTQTLRITLGTPGVDLDVEAIYNAVLDAYSFNTFQVTPDLSWSEESAALPPAPDIEAIYQAVYIAPVSATMNNQTFEPIPGSYGYSFDRQAAQILVDGAEYGQTVTVPMLYLEPEIQDDELLFQDVLGECATKHNDNEKRNNNLRVVCQYLDGLVLQPGEEFSYNERVGERTAARGFQAAPAYSGTKLVDSIGGGVCQGSSTIYFCALLADMEITDRINHGFKVGYMDFGMDATVSWNGPDFKFRNTSNYPIKILAEVSGGYMRMKIMGTEERDYYIKMEYEITRTITPTVVYEEHDPDSGYTDGQIIEGGTNGYHVKTYKCKYSRETDALISRDFCAFSSYMTENRIVAKVEKKEEPKPTEPSEPSEPSQPTDPAPTEPAPTEPKPTDPAPTEPKPTDPAPTEPKPTDPAPTEPKPTDPPETAPPTQPPETNPPTQPPEPPAPEE